jgi:protoporphyrin/coproporphyrin ferrochelatase
MHKQAILLINLGSPDSPSVPDVKTYLDEFLMDPYVIDLPYLLRFAIVKGIILNTRPKKSAEAYQTIWKPEGSPLIIISEQLQAALSKKTDIPIGLAMRYGNPSIHDGIDALVNQHPHLEKIIAVPLYPHYAMASTKTVIEKTNQVISEHFPQLSVDYVPPFYQHPEYIKALSASINHHLPNNVDHLLFSYHGIPVRHVKKTDPTKKHCFKSKDCCMIPNSAAHAVCYPHQIKRTTELVAQHLPLRRDQWSWSYQSRLGTDEWLQPFTDKEFERLAKEGVKNLAVCCPAFVSDCLETIEEIGEEGKEIFKHHGGETFTLIPCLNTDDAWVDALKQVIYNGL